MPRKPTKSSLTKRMDDIMSLRVREAKNHRCEVCGDAATQVHHYWTRELRRLRWNPRNLVACCYSCHMWAHGQKPGIRGGFARFDKWMETRRPDDYAFLNVPENHAPMPGITLTYLRDLHEEMTNG